MPGRVHDRQGLELLGPFAHGLLREELDVAVERELDVRAVLGGLLFLRGHGDAHAVAGVAGAVFYIVHHIVVKTALFLVAVLLLGVRRFRRRSGDAQDGRDADSDDRTLEEIAS